VREHLATLAAVMRNC